MAEEDEDEQDEEEEAAPIRAPQQASLLKYLPIVVLVLLMQAAGAYFAIDHFLFPGAEGEGVQDEAGRAKTIPEGDQPEDSVDLGAITANPRGTKARLLVRTKVTLGVAPGGAVGEIEKETNLDRVKDVVLQELGNATHEELQSFDGREKVKERMRQKINRFLYRGQVQVVYFEEFILQAMSGYKKQ